LSRLSTSYFRAVSVDTRDEPGHDVDFLGVTGRV
jgi:hypothetical protein